jgi:membrane protease YdiL (CAAX protease family)
MSVILRVSKTVLLAGLAAFAITGVGQTLWGGLVMANLKLTPSLPWAALVMPFVLAALVAFLAGRFGSKAGAEARRKLIPLAPVSARAWTWALIAGAAGNIVGAALWTVMATLVRVPPNALPDTQGAPALTLVSILIISVIAPPLSEEIAFRGYAMGMLRRHVSPVTALVITSALFAAAHLTQGLYAPKLLVYFLAGLSFGFVALRTGSLLPAMVVHSTADLTFFTMVWSHDAGRRLIGEGGANGWFFLCLAILAAGTPLTLLAFRQLVRVTASPADERIATAPAMLAAAA